MCCFGVTRTQGTDREIFGVENRFPHPTENSFQQLSIRWAIGYDVEMEMLVYLERLVLSKSTADELGMRLDLFPHVLQTIKESLTPFGGATGTAQPTNNAFHNFGVGLDSFPLKA